MKLRLTLILFCLLGIGLFAKSQDKKRGQSKPTVENGADAIPVMVKSTKKVHRKLPAPPLIDKDRKPLPPQKIGAIKFTPPKIVKDAPKPPPPPPVKARKTIL